MYMGYPKGTTFTDSEDNKVKLIGDCMMDCLYFDNMAFRQFICVTKEGRVITYNSINELTLDTEKW